MKLRVLPAFGVVLMTRVAVASAADASETSVERYPSIWQRPTEVPESLGEWRGFLATRDFKRVGKGLVSVGPRGVFLSNRLTGVGLAGADRGLGIQSLYSFQTRRESIAKVGEKPTLFRIVVRHSDGKMTTLSNMDSGVLPSVKTEARSDGGIRAVLIWERVRVAGTSGDLNVKVTITLPARTHLPKWHLVVENRVRGAVLWKVIFPIVEHLGYPGESNALVHSTYSMMRQGELHRRAKGLLNWLYMGDPETYVYPSGAFPIQHLSVSIGSDTVVYIGWHDRHANPKGYVYDVDKSLTCWGYPDNMGDEGVSYDPTYDTVIGPMPGDWFTAASVYRDWAHRQFWCKRGPRIKWPENVRKGVVEIPYWARPDWWDQKGQYNPAWAETVTRRIKNEEQWIGSPLGIHWYGWHHCRFDGNYPEYFPPQPGFAEEAKRESAVGWTVAPFINGFWYDLRTAGGEKATSWAVVSDPSGKLGLPDPKTVDPRSQSSIHAYMCPSCVGWHRELAQISRRLRREFDAKMVYLDISANAQPLPCFNRDHPHPPGRGRWWVEGMNRQVQAIKSAADGVAFAQSECFNEALGATLDTNLIWTERYPWEAPLLGSVYGGWLSYYGSRVYPWEHIVTFTAKLTRDIFWGGALGAVINEWWADSKTTPHARVLISLARFRRTAKEFLIYGEMIRPPQRISAPVWIKLRGWQCEYSRPIGEFEMEAVERVVWRAPNGKVGLALMNYGDENRRVEFDLSTMPGLGIASPPQVIRAEGAPPCMVTSERERLGVELPSRTPVMVVIGQTTTPARSRFCR